MPVSAVEVSLTTAGEIEKCERPGVRRALLLLSHVACACKVYSPRAICLKRSTSYDFFRRRLHHVIIHRAFHGIFVWSLIYNHVASAKIVKWRRGSSGPFQRSRLPRIIGSDWSLESAPYQVEEENQLRGASCQSCNRDEFMHRYQGYQIIVNERGVAAHVSGQSEIMHRHKNAINADERQPEMPLAERVVHHAAEHFRKPEISGCKHPEDRCHRHHEVKMGDHEICAVQIDVQRRLRQKKTADSSANKYGNEAETEKRRSVEAHLGAVHCSNQKKGKNGSWNRNEQGWDGEQIGRERVHTT